MSGRWMMTVAACVLAAGVGLASPGAAAAGRERPVEQPAQDGRSAGRTRMAERLRESAPGTAGPVQAAADGDLVTITDPVDTFAPPIDIRQVSVATGPDGALVFSTQVEQYSDPAITLHWLAGTTAALWGLDTSGDAAPELVVAFYNGGLGLVAEVIDIGTGTFTCEAVPSTSAQTKSYTVTVTDPGCLGEVRDAAVIGAFEASFGLDYAPSDRSLVRFTRPPPGRPAGGYAVATSGAGFQRYGVLAPGATPAGTFEDYIGPRPLVGTTSTRAFDPALWSVTDDGEVSTQDGGEWYGDTAGIALHAPIVGMAMVPDRSGYWLVARDGGIFAFGDATFYGSTGAMALNQPIVGMAASPTGQGYWLVAADGGIFAFGDAGYFGSTGALRLNRPVVGMAAGYQGQGYWLVASDGGIFAFGLPFHGSTGAMVLQQPIVGMAATRSGGGYRFVARDGGVFCFGDAEFHGSAALPGRTDIVGLATA